MTQIVYGRENSNANIGALHDRINALESEKRERATKLLFLSEKLNDISAKTRILADKVEESKNKAYLDGLLKAMDIICKTELTNNESKELATNIMYSIRMEIEQSNTSRSTLMH